MVTLHGLFSPQLQDAFNFILIHCRTCAHQETTCYVYVCAHMGTYTFLSSKYSMPFWFYNLDLVIPMSRILPWSRRHKSTWIFQMEKFCSKFYLTQLGRHFWFPVPEPSTRHTEEHFSSPVYIRLICMPHQTREGNAEAQSSSSSSSPFISPRASCPNFYFFAAICFTSLFFFPNPQFPF